MSSLNPLKIIGWWILLIAMVDIVAIPCFALNAVGNGQKPLTFLVSSVKIAIDGVFLLSVLSSILFFKQFRRFWVANTVVILILGVFVFRNRMNQDRMEYVFKEKIDSIGGYLVMSRTEYYNLERSQVRSRCYWKNGQKDSVWTVYSQTGVIIKQDQYKSGSLVQ
jgi:hypothetical protein